MSVDIPFNKPYLTGKEAHYLYQAVYSGKLSGNGLFTQKCHRFFEQRYHFRKCLLTTSCTDALEMAAILSDVGPGDEVIIPSFTFVSTANAFVLRGAKVVFVDSNGLNPNMDVQQVEALITERTRVIVPVHYGGVACDMDAIMALADKYNLIVVEDAAQAIDAYYGDRPLGGIGHLAAFSFHETKNVIAGEGGMLVINDERFIGRSEIIWEKGTNRSAFWRGEVDKYGWVDIGSSFLPSEVVAAFLYAQLENLDTIQQRRKAIWRYYYDHLQPLAAQAYFSLPHLPDYSTENGHLFYLVCRSEAERDGLITFLKQQGVYAVFHYLSLHKSPYYRAQHGHRDLPNSDFYTGHVVRLPLFFELEQADQAYIIQQITRFYEYQKEGKS